MTEQISSFEIPYTGEAAAAEFLEGAKAAGVFGPPAGPEPPAGAEGEPPAPKAPEEPPAPDADPLVNEVWQALSVKTAEDALATAQAAYDAALLTNPLGSVDTEQLKQDVLGATFDRDYATITSQGIEALEARQQELAFQAEEKRLAEKQFGDDMPLHKARTAMERVELENEAARLKSMVADRRTIEKLNEDAESKARSDVAEVYRLADEKQIAELISNKVEQYEIDTAKAQAQIPPEGRPTFKDDLAGALNGRRAANYEVMRADWIQKQLTNSRTVTPPAYAW